MRIGRSARGGNANFTGNGVYAFPGACQSHQWADSVTSFVGLEFYDSQYNRANNVNYLFVLLASASVINHPEPSTTVPTGLAGLLAGLEFVSSKFSGKRK